MVQKTTHRTAQTLGNLEDFIKEHKSDTSGDLDKLDDVIKRPTQGTEKATHPTSPQGASGD